MPLPNASTHRFLLAPLASDSCSHYPVVTIQLWTLGRSLGYSYGPIGTVLTDSATHSRECSPFFQEGSNFSVAIDMFGKVSWGGIPTRTHVFWPNLNQPIQPIQACWPLRWQAKTLRGSEAARLTHQEIHANNLITELKSKGVKHDTDCWWNPGFC